LIRWRSTASRIFEAGYHATVGRGIALMLAAALVAGSCTTMRPALPAAAPRSAVVIDAVETRDCLRTTVGRDGLGDGALPGAVEDPELLAELAQVPADVRRTARAAGLEPVLAALLRAQVTGQDPRSIEVVAMRLQVVMRISSLEIELAALLFEADCTGDQMEAALLELDRQAGKQELALTIASIAVGALAGLGAGLWDVQGTDSKGPAVLGIAGGGWRRRRSAGRRSCRGADGWCMRTGATCSCRCCPGQIRSGCTRPSCFACSRRRRWPGK
jgi:hypothetical protein